MEQRPLRLGDIVDDYCPRERRITNHAIVALVGETIRQTRCATCDAEHVYKEAKVPRRGKKKDETEALVDEVLAAHGSPKPLVTRPEHTPSEAEPATPVPVLAAAEDAPLAEEPSAEAAPAPDEANDEPALPDEERARDGWLSQRQLIRASLPKGEVEPPARPIPEFTMYQRQTRGSHAFRHGGGWSDRSNGNRGEVNGNTMHPPSGRHGGGHSHGFGHGHGQGPGQGPGQGQGHGRRRRRHGKHKHPR